MGWYFSWYKSLSPFSTIFNRFMLTYGQRFWLCIYSYFSEIRIISCISFLSKKCIRIWTNQWDLQYSKIFYFHANIRRLGTSVLRPQIYKFMCVCISMCIHALTFTISQLERGQRNASTGLMCTVSHSSLDQKKTNPHTLPNPWCHLVLFIAFLKVCQI